MYVVKYVRRKARIAKEEILLIERSLLYVKGNSNQNPLNTCIHIVLVSDAIHSFFLTLTAVAIHH
jgi:hypothetical protein